MKVIKRDGKVEVFNLEKIMNAVEKAFKSVNLEIDPKFAAQLSEHFQKINDNCTDEDCAINIEEIQDEIEKFLIKKNKTSVAKRFIIYREERNRIRESKSKLIKGVASKLKAKDIVNQNANVDEASFGGRIGEASRVVTKEYALNYCMSKMARENHLNNEIYIHDLDSYAVGMHNCLTLPFDKLLRDGFKTRNTDVRGANSVNTAMQLVAVLFQLQSLQQFGGVSASHIDWTMVPYVRKSFFKYFKDGVKYCEGLDKLDIEISSPEEKSIDDEKYKSLGNAYKYAMDMTKREIHQAVEGMYHNLNTLQSRSGNQLPFTSINYGTCTLTEGRMIIEELLKVSIEGLGSKGVTSIFPCGIFQCMNGVNRHPGDKNYDLFRLALKSTTQRIYPNYANVDWSGNAGYDKNDPKTYFSTMGCHAFNTPIIMGDGTQKMVQDIVVGDSVMGADGTPRTVLSLIRGNDRLFRVDQSRGESYVVNEGHILSLEYSVNRKYKNFKKGDRINMSVHDYLKLPDYIRRYFKGYKGSYDLPEKEFDIPPYILGLWLGDGNSNGTRFSVNSNEHQILRDLEEYAKSIDKDLKIKQDREEQCFVVDITNSEKRNDGNKFRRALFGYDLIGNKHIPECYFYGSKEQRKALLAGLINTDGWARNGRGRKTICFGNTNFDLICGAKRIADSLGYATNIILARGQTIGTGICEGSVLKPYYHLSIHGFDDEHLMPNKRTDTVSTHKRNFSTSTLKITEIEKGDFYGFELDGDRLYLFNDCTVTHNCRTANGFDINGLGQTKDGRGNLCPVTIILPTLAMNAKAMEGDVVENFITILDKKISEAKDMLLERFNYICSQSPESAKFMYENGTMEGYIPEEGIKSALKHGTLAVGQLGLAECLQILIGCDHTEERGMELAKRIEGLFNKRCSEFKQAYKLNFGVYYTPAENLCHTAMKKFKAKFGVIENVSDRDYFTNSMHVPVWHDIDAYTKIDIESQLTSFSNAGCITYVEVPSKAMHNIDAMEDLVNYAMDKDIPYFAINLPIDTCTNCGYRGEIVAECPMCGCTEIERLARVTGYLSTDVTNFNKGKQSETRDRVDHFKN